MQLSPPSSYGMPSGWSLGSRSLMSRPSVVDQARLASALNTTDTCCLQPGFTTASAGSTVNWLTCRAPSGAAGAGPASAAAAAGPLRPAGQGKHYGNPFWLASMQIKYMCRSKHRLVTSVSDILHVTPPQQSGVRPITPFSPSSDAVYLASRVRCEVSLSLWGEGQVQAN